MDATLQLVRTSTQVDYPIKCILESILSATMWPAQRVHAIAPSVSRICPRCNQAEESSLHCFWTCPCNTAIEDEAVVSTQNLVQAAETHSKDIPCLWLRGILPSELTTVPEQYAAPDEFTPIYINPPTHYTSGKYYGDGSGGEFSSYSTLRRCGCSVVQVDSDGTKFL